VPNEKGLTCLLMVGTTANAPTTFTKLEGQTDTSFSGTVNVADTTDKDNAGWVTGLATTRSGTVTASGNVKTPRPMLDLLQAAWVAGTTHGCSVVFDTAGKGYRGEFYVTDFSISGATDDVSKYNVTLTPAAALTANPVV
jgi:predicted secreted protein